MDMFEKEAEELKQKEAPLATRMRPATFSDFVGQEHLIGPGRVLRKAIETGKIPSVILWGPPGSGKTTLAYIIADATESHFSPVSAVSAGVADLRRIIDEANERRQTLHQQTILFIDEIHRFNKAQQDAVLPFVEDGTITLIGATTENPSFEVIAPLLSRCQVLTLNPLTDDEIRLITMRALKDTIRGLGTFNIEIEPDSDALSHLITMSTWRWLPWRHHRTLMANVVSHWLLLKTLSSIGHCAMIRAESNTTTPYPPSTSHCEAQTRTLLYTGWHGCWRPGKTPSILPAA